MFCEGKIKWLFIISQFAIPVTVKDTFKKTVSNPIIPAELAI